MRARRGQPQEANHWCFNRHLNAVNLAPGNGGVDFEKKNKKKNKTQTLGKRGLFFPFFTGEKDEKDKGIQSSAASRRQRRHNYGPGVIY